MKLKSCSELALAFVQKVEKEAQGFNKVCLIFDRYTEESLNLGPELEELGVKLLAIKFLTTLLL